MSDLHDTLRLEQLDPSRWRRIRVMLDGALDLPAEQRGRYLDRVGADAPDLRAYVENLIAADAGAGEFLNAGPRAIDEPPLEPPFTWGRLEARAKLGEGSYGAVFRAHDPAIGQDVALKLWHQHAARPEHHDRLVREARRLARVRHPNILVVHGIDEHDGRMGLWSELIDGTTLEDALAASGPTSPAEAVEVGIVVCDALSAMHSAGLIHQDVKSTNVMRDRTGRIVLVDFGTVRELTGAGVIATDEPPAGTPATMAPEQLAGAGVGPEADVYGVGVLLYRLVTGSLPVEGKTTAELKQRHAAHAGVPLSRRRPGLSAAFVAVVERAIATDGAERFPSARALQRALCELPEASAVPPHVLPLPLPEGSHLLPRSLTRFIGREAALSECRRLLARSRLLTLTGPAGSGKTRIALALGERQAGRFGGGARFVDLALVGGPDSVLDGVTTALGVRPGPDQDAQQELVTQLTGAPALLLLDNCEHVAGEVARRVEWLLAACPQLSVLATSRAPLAIAGEVVYPVPPLELPCADDPVEVIARRDAVQLFAERASQVRADFRLDRDVAADVAEICRRLEGLPLAIELAASNARLLTPAQMLERLREGVLEMASPALPARHRTLDAAIQWSYDLLDPEERLLLPALAVFEGGWTGSAAAAVCLPRSDWFQALERLNRLVDASLVTVENRPYGLRYRMLETVRTFARERLERSGERQEIRRRHIAYFRAMAVRSERAFWGPAQSEWLSRLDEDHANLVAAARASAVVPGELESGLALAGSLYRYWYARGLARAGRSLLSELLAHPMARPDGEAWLKALYASAGLALVVGDVTQARSRFEEGLRYGTEQGPEAAARWLIGLSNVAQRAGNFDEARAHLMESLRVHRERGDEPAQILALHNLAEVDLCQGRLDAAREREQEALQRARAIDNPLFVSIAEILLGSIAARQGDAPQARERLRAARPGVRSVRARVLGIEFVEAAAELAAAVGDVGLAARWLAVTGRERDAWGLMASPAQSLALASLRERTASGAPPSATAAGELRPGPARPHADVAAATEEVEGWLDRE